jgi:serine/threonine protein kinase
MCCGCASRMSAAPTCWLPRRWLPPLCAPLRTSRVIDSDRTSSKDGWALVGWVRSIEPATRAWTAPWRSKCSRRTCHAIGRRDRFEREARAVAALNHPNICTLHDIGEAPAGAGPDPIRFLVMEFVEGTTLDFPGELPLAPTRVAEIAAQVCDGLEAAHARGIVHRDLKPLNLMLTPRGQVKVLDFGVARLDQAAGDQPAHASAIQTGTGLIVGTLGYMSPEQLSGDRVTAASEIFSLGLVLYRLLTGRHPFAAAEEPHAHMQALLHALLVHTPRPPHHYEASVPPALDALVLRMLEKDPAASPSRLTGLSPSP